MLMTGKRLETEVYCSIASEYVRILREGTLESPNVQNMMIKNKSTSPMAKQKKKTGSGILGEKNSKFLISVYSL